MSFFYLQTYLCYDKCSPVATLQVLAIDFLQCKFYACKPIVVIFTNVNWYSIILPEPKKYDETAK